MNAHPFRLYLVTDSVAIGEKNLEEVVKEAMRGGVTAVQLREKNKSLREWVELGRAIKDILRGTGIPLLINDRVDVALEVGAQGVHLGQNDLCVLKAREILGRKFLLGLTVENLAQVKKAQDLEVDYLGLSALFPTKTKDDVRSFWTDDEIKEARNISKHWLIGIGGVNEQNARRPLNLGLDGVAVCGAICEGNTLEEVRERAQRLRDIVEGRDETI